MTRTRPTWLVGAAMAAVVILSGGCGPDAPQIGTGDPTPTAEQTPPDDPGPPTEEADVPAELESATEQAVADLAGRTGADPAAIEVVTAEHVTWRDGAVGCPEPGGMYTQALVEGYRIELRADGDTYHYHGAAGEPPFHCPDERRSDAYGDDAPDR